MKSAVLTTRVAQSPEQLTRRGATGFFELGFAYFNRRFRGVPYLITYEHNGDISKYYRTSVTPNLTMEVEVR